jgi:transcriptional regulator with XRE-family HTH domain
MDENIRIGKRIKAARERNNLTQEELGKKLGLNKSSIQRYETGKIQKIKLPILENIAFILGVNPSWLALKTDDPTYYGENTDAPGSLIDDTLPTPEITDSQLKFALFGDAEIDDDVLDDVKRLAKLHAEMRKQEKNEKK